MRTSHPDKADPPDSPRARELNAAKEACLERVSGHGTAAGRSDSDKEVFVLHISRIMQAKMGLEHDLSVLIRPRLHDFMHIRAVDAVEWILRCGMGEMPFEQRKHEEIPVLCRYYNAFIGPDNWDDDAHTIMTVLNKYETIAAKGMGNFARTLPETQ